MAWSQEKGGGGEGELKIIDKAYSSWKEHNGPQNMHRVILRATSPQIRDRTSLSIALNFVSLYDSSLNTTKPKLQSLSLLE